MARKFILLDTFCRDATNKAKLTVSNSADTASVSDLRSHDCGCWLVESLYVRLPWLWWVLGCPVRIPLLGLRRSMPFRRWATALEKTGKPCPCETPSSDGGQDHSRRHICQSLPFQSPTISGSSMCSLSCVRWLDKSQKVLSQIAPLSPFTTSFTAPRQHFWVEGRKEGRKEGRERARGSARDRGKKKKRKQEHENAVLMFANRWSKDFARCFGPACLQCSSATCIAVLVVLLAFLWCLHLLAHSVV